MYVAKIQLIVIKDIVYTLISLHFSHLVALIYLIYGKPISTS